MAPAKASFMPLALEDGDNDAGKDEKISKRSKRKSAVSVPYSQSRGIVYLSHLPNGFQEKQLRNYLSQFGAVTNLRLGRSSKTGGPKGYAFVEFRYPEVARIVCDTMNNYLMFDKIVKCEMVAEEKASRKMFRDKVDPKHPPLKAARMTAKKQVNQLRTEKQNNLRLKRQLKRLEGLKRKLDDAGIKSEIDFVKKTISSSSGKRVAAAATKSPVATKSPLATKSPVVTVDDDDDEISVKTPSNVRVTKSSRSNSAINTPRSAMGTPKRGAIGAGRTTTQRALTMAANLVAAEEAKKAVVGGRKKGVKEVAAGSKKEGMTKKKGASPKVEAAKKKKTPVKTPKSVQKTPAKTPKSVQKKKVEKDALKTPKSAQKKFDSPKVEGKKTRGAVKTPKSAKK